MGFSFGGLSNVLTQMRDSRMPKFLDREPKANTKKNRLITMASKRAIAPIFTFRDFNNLATSKHYQDLKNLCDLLINKHPDFSIPEGKLNNLGLQLIFNPQKGQSFL